MNERFQYKLAALVGDGIGPEIVPPAMRLIDAAMAVNRGPAISWQELPYGLSAISEYGEAVPARTLEGLKSVDGWLMGPHDSASYPEPHKSALSPGGTIRKHFALFANIRPAKSFAGARAVVPGTDLVIVRENTEGLYADRNTFAGAGEFMPTADVAIMHGIVTRTATARIAHEAFRLARRRSKQVTIVHKANVLKLTSGLFLEVALDIARQYPEVSVNDFHIDALAARLVRHADEFDVILAENMFGDILSDLAGEIAGSLGIASSLNSSATVAMAQAAHGSAPDIAGQNLANPIAMILSSTMLLHWLAGRTGEKVLQQAANSIEAAVELTVSRGLTTPDLGGTSRTSEFVDAVASSMTTSCRAGALSAARPSKPAASGPATAIRDMKRGGPVLM